MDKFNVLPTDKKFLSLYEEQKLMLFEGINSLPNNEYIRKLNIMHSRRKEIEDKKYDEFVSKQLKMTMIKTYEKQGMNLEQIEKEIKKFCEMQRKLELKKIDEQQGKIIL